MKLTSNALCELIVRDFAVRYLDLKPPFELSEVLERTNNGFDGEIKNEDLYTLGDIRYCMRVLKLNNSFSHIRADEYTVINTKELLTYKQNEGHDLQLFLYDIINSLPFSSDTATGKITRCKKCGQLFIPDHGNRKLCYYCDAYNGAKI